MANGKRRSSAPAKRKRSSREDVRGEHRNISSHVSHATARRYAFAALRNVFIAVSLLSVAYLGARHFDEPAVSTKVATSEKLTTTPKSEDGRKGEALSRRDVHDRRDAAEQTGVSQAAIGTTAFVSGNNVLIREHPKPNSKVLGKAIFGTSIEVLAFDGNWVQIRSPAQNLSGWTEKMRVNF